MPPLLLSDEEAVATVVGLRFAALAQVDGATGAAEAALRKLEHVLPPRLRRRMEAVSASTDAISRSTQSLDLGTLQTLATAAHAHHDVRFTYVNRAGQSSQRRVEPYRQVLLGRRWYLLGWDLDRLDWRTFRLDRITDLTTPRSTFAPRELPPDGAVSFVRSSARSPISRHQGVVRFAAPLALVSDRLMAEAGSLEAIDEDNCRYVTAPDSWEWLAITLAMVGVPYVIEGPPDLISCSRQLAERISLASDQSTHIPSGKPPPRYEGKPPRARPRGEARDG